MVLATFRPAIRSFFKHACQLLQHPVQIVHDLVIGETQRRKPMVAKHRPIAVRIGHRVMCIAIHFDHQPFRRTEEIDDPVPDKHLPPELETIQTLSAQLVPKAPFGFGHIAAHSGGANAKRLWRDATTPNPLL